MMNTSLEIDKVSDAIAQAQGKITNAQTTSDNPYFRSKYADLAEIYNVIRAAFSEVGVAIVQGVSSAIVQNESIPLFSVAVTTRLAHKSGQWIEDTFSMPVLKIAKKGSDEAAVSGIPGAQDFGRVSTYARRYGLAAICGVAQEDSDAEADGTDGYRAASHRAEPRNEPTEEAPRAKAPEGDVFALRDELKKLILDKSFSDRDRTDFFAHLGEMKTADTLAAYKRKWTGVLSERRSAA